MDAAEKARKKADKEAAKSKSLDADEKFDAFGNKIVIKEAAKKIPKSELKKIKKAGGRTAQAGPGGLHRRGGREGRLHTRVSSYSRHMGGDARVAVQFMLLPLMLVVQL